MKNMKKYIALFVCALALVASAGVSRTNAYFTARTEAIGHLKVSAKIVRTVPVEEGEELQKVIKVQNTGEADCWARVKLVYPSTVNVEVQPSIANDPNWKNVGEYWYYMKILPKPTGTAPSLSETSIKADVTIKDGDLKDVLSEFNVIVVTECIPVMDYEVSEPPIEADGWAQEFKIVEEG